MLKAHNKKELLDYLYEQIRIEKCKLEKLNEIKEFDSECSGAVHNVRKDYTENMIYTINCIINQYLHI